MLRRTLPTRFSMSALGVFVGFAAMPTASAEGPGSSDQAGDQRGRRCRRVGDEQDALSSGAIVYGKNHQGLPERRRTAASHLPYHEGCRAPSRPSSIQVTGDDGSNELFYDGKSVSIFSPDRKAYAVIAAPGDIRSALTEVVDKLNIDFPLVNFFAVSPERALLREVVAGWQVGTANIDGVECRHLFFHQKAGIDLELWVEKNNAAIPHRLIVTYRLLPGQPSFIAEFTNWDTQVHPSELRIRLPSARRRETDPADSSRCAGTAKGSSDEASESLSPVFSP